MESMFRPASVSNLVPAWDGGHGLDEPVAPGLAAAVVRDAVQAEERPLPPAPSLVREQAPPRDASPSPYAFELLTDEESAWADPADDEYETPVGELDVLTMRDLAREALRARIIAFAEQREHRSAYEIVFILLAASVAILLAAPPLVQVLLAAHGIQA